MTTTPLMQVFTGSAHNRCHTLDAPGAYEWWYVDALSDDAEWGVVAILFRGMPMSPDYLSALAAGRDPVPADHCGFAVSIYHQGRRLFQEFRGVDAGDTFFGTNECDVRVGPCSLQNTTADAWTLHIDTVHPDSPRRVVLDATFRRIGTVADDATPFTAVHGWVLAAPLANIDVHLTLSDYGRVRTSSAWHGKAYHDHNMGRRAMQEDFRTWLWGRVHHDESGLVYLATPDATEPFAFAATLDEYGITPWTSVRIVAEERRLTMMGLRAARRVTLDGDGGAWTIDQHSILDDGPFYRRYLAMFANGSVRHAGISEDMHVQRYRASWIRPFLRTPWLRQ